MKKPELKGIAVMLLIALVLGVLLAGISGKLEQWGLPWFTGARALDKIVFVSDRSGTKEIYMMNLDGTDQKQLTHGAKVLSGPAVSASGNKIAFVGMLGSASQVMAIGINGGTHAPLTASTGPKRLPAYSPDGKKLSYIGSGRVFVAELNGNNPNAVLPTSEEMIAARSNPDISGIPLYSAYSWAPDGQSIAGVSSQDRISDALVYLPEIPTGELLRITPEKVIIKVTGPAFAKDKPVFAASLDFSGQGILVLFDTETKQAKQVSALPKVKFGTPAVSPDGSIIVVPMSSPTGKPAPGLARFDVESDRHGTLAKGIFEDAVFSADGSAILAAMRDKKDGKRCVVTVDPETGDVIRLTRDGDSYGAVYTPASAK